MPARQLPARPSLDQLKRQAKELLQSARDDAPGARARFRALPAFQSLPDPALARAQLALHDAQSVIAREHGFDSWNQLRDEVEARTLEFGAAVDQFIEAATDGRRDRAERILALFPSIASANFYTALLSGDAAAVSARLGREPGLALEVGGPRNWAPLHYVCYTSIATDDTRINGLVAMARQLLSLGADPNTRFPWPHHGVHRPVLWGAAMVVRALPLVELLLEAGADPNDGVTLVLAASAGNLPLLELLHRHGARVDQPWATDGSTALYAILAWSRTNAGAVWLLEHGADPNAVFPENGETSMHAVARTGDVELAAVMLRCGGDIGRRRADGRTPYAIAALGGHQALADWLVAQGASSEMSDADRLVALCSRGDRTGAEGLLARHPSLREQLTDDHYIAFHQAAERSDLEALAAMLAAGFDPNRPDPSIGKTALHSAAMAGQPEAVRLLLAHGASVTVRDREFQGQPLIWAAEGSRNHAAASAAYTEVGRLLIQAGSPVEWAGTTEPSEGILEIVEGWRRM